MMSKSTFAIKIDDVVVKSFKSFCNAHGIKYSFFIEDAIKRKLAEEELKEDILDLKTLRREEKDSVSLDQYLKERDV
jgi:hypothetical protein